MKRFKNFYTLFLVTIITACAPFGRLYKEQARVTLALPANRQAEAAVITKHDSVPPSPVLNYTIISANGDSIPVGMSVEWDSIHKESLTTMALDEIVVSASSIRNTAERNGLINLEFVVTVPKALQRDNWMVMVRPVLMRGVTTDSLKELRFTGRQFREMQERDYRRYDQFVKKIIPDSANFYQTYVNYRPFEHYLERLEWFKHKLEKRWALQEVKKHRPDPLLLRFEMFNGQMARRDSLMKKRMLNDSYRMITRQWWQYNRALEQVNDSLRLQSKNLQERFRYFNDKWARHILYQAEELVARKKFFYDRSPLALLRQAETRHKFSPELSEKEIYAYYGQLPLSTYHRDLSDSAQLRIPAHKAFRNLEISRFDSAFTIGRYIRHYEKLRSLFPQFRLKRELCNIHPPALKHAARQAKYGKQIARIDSIESNNLVKRFYNTRKIARNEARKAIRNDRFHNLIRFPFNPEAQLDTVIYATDRIQYLYSQKVPADENSARMKVYVMGNVLNSKGSKYPLPKSDTLTYLVSSMINFIDRTPRFVRKIITRDAEANTSVNFYFPQNGFHLDETIDINRKGVKQVHDLTLALMTDPVYIIDSLTLFASSSPEGNWRINGEIAQKRAESIREVLTQDFKQLHDSLAIGTAIEIDETGNSIHRKIKDEIPNLPELIKICTVPEDWDKLRSLIVGDTDFKGQKDAIVRIIDREPDPDRREWLIKSQYKAEYAYMLDKLYPAVRSVDFRFSLSRRGMQQDTIYTDEPDTAYARAVELLEKRKYKQALEILRSYEDVNTAIAYMSLGYDKAALRIFGKSAQTAETKYMQAILNARLGDERQAVLLLTGAVEMNAQMRFRANLDPELSKLVKKYRLFQEDDF